MTEIPDPDMPSEADVALAVKAIHDSPEMLVLAVTGGFAGLQQLLWETPGASRTLLDAVFPYAPAAFKLFAGSTPSSFASAEAAVLLAQASYRRARELSGSLDSPVIGLGATAALLTDRAKKGACRMHVAVVGKDGKLLDTRERVLTPEQSVGWSRHVQGRYGDLLALECLLAALNLPPLAVSMPYTHLSLAEWEPWVVMLADGGKMPIAGLDPAKHSLYPGSYSPVHPGHHKVAEAAHAQTGLEPVFLIEIDHPIKGKLSEEVITRRLAQFLGKASVLVTSGAGLYIEKARRFPGFGFIVGADTMRRICDPYFYEDGDGLLAVIDEFVSLGTRFHVFDRIDDGRLRTLGDIEMPEALRAICMRREGRWDISSTEVRNRS